MTEWLVVFDTPGIKEFVFGTDTLREIQGASALLDGFNRYEMEPLLERAWPGSVETVFANGGTGQFILSGGGEGGVVESACQAVARELAKRTRGSVALNYGYAPLDGTTYSEAVQTAHRRMRFRRWSSPRTQVVATSPLLRECASSSSYPASAYVNSSGDVLAEGDPKGAWLSDVAQAKLKGAEHSRYRSQRSLWAEYERHVGSRPWTVLEEAGAQANRVGYIGVVYADGNSMGSVVKQLPDRDTCEAFSQIVDTSVRRATYDVLREHDYNSLPLLLGGDDVVMVMPANDALRFASRLPDEFERWSRELMQKQGGAAGEWLLGERPRGFSLSVGVAIGRHRMPFHLLLDLAEQLLKSAKKGAVDAKLEDKARVDFHVTTSSSVRPISEVRRQDMRLKGPGNQIYHRTRRPYRPAELLRLLEAVEQLRGLRIPRSKVADLWEAAFAPTVMEAQIGAIEAIGRLRKHRDLLEGVLAEFGCRGVPPFGDDRRTILADLVECYQVTAGGA